MCELLGFTSEKNTDISEYLRTFFTHSRNNPHGWGMMYENDNNRIILKEPVNASESCFLSDMIDFIQPQKNLLAHIRFATVGSVNEKNCHPFTGKDVSGREWTLIHNGTIFNSRHSHRYSVIQEGDTDSERFFLSMIDTINEHISKSVQSEHMRFEIINNFIVENAPRNKLNLMIYDGDILYVHKNLKNTLCFKRLEKGIIFSTKPLDNSPWIPFPMAQVIAYKNGHEVYRGDRHKGIFIPPLEYIRAMDAMYI
ncbi:MAG: class II glutamine amidotransferase [Ruminococcus sp.]|nr:class II glutamine amidotransferase [Ruminococcus sp.]